jgi:hypothetical protein
MRTGQAARHVQSADKSAKRAAIVLRVRRDLEIYSAQRASAAGR